MFRQRRALILLLTLTLVLVATNGYAAQKATYDEASFTAAIENATENDALIKVYKNFLTNSTDIDVAVKAQDAWLELDETGALETTFNLAELHPESPKFIYLKGRQQATAEEKVLAGRQAISLDPEFAPAYRLVCGTYNQTLFRGRGNDDDTLWLERQLKTDAGFFQEAVNLEPEAEWSLAYLYGMQKYHDNWEDALEILLKGKEMNARFAADWYIASAYLELHQYDEALQEFVEGADKSIVAGEMESADKEEYIFVRYAALLQRNRLWSRLEDYVRSIDGWETNPDYLVVLAESQAVQLDMDAALVHLQVAADNGLDSLSDLDGITGIVDFADDKRLIAIWDQVQANWDVGAPERKAEMMAGMISRPAPLWTLANAAGDSISLADLKGDIIILDFWATWCSPCRMAMPVLSNWMKTEMPAGVRVFSVNVWENNVPGAISFIATNNYAMELVFGNNELAAAYGVEGIPYICAIDTEGNIRFEEVGFSDALGEKLGWWVEELGRK